MSNEIELANNKPGRPWPGRWYFLDDDLIVTGTTATWFGGAHDPLDDGRTASGISTIPPLVMGCALPVCWWHPSTALSPLYWQRHSKAHPDRRLPSIPWMTEVTVSDGRKSVRVELIDNGPSRSAGDGIDLTCEAFRQFAPLDRGVLTGISIRIPMARDFSPFPIQIILPKGAQ